jgi:hypothetical protein
MASTDYRQPTPAEKAKLDKSRAMMVEGINEEKSPITRLMPTMTKAARDQQKSATPITTLVTKKVAKLKRWLKADRPQAVVMAVLLKAKPKVVLYDSLAWNGRH